MRHEAMVIPREQFSENRSAGEAEQKKIASEQFIIQYHIDYFLQYHGVDHKECLIIIHQYSIKKQVNIAPQAPYSPDMAQYDFFLCPRMK